MLILPSGRIENYFRELLEYYYELNTPEEEKYKRIVCHSKILAF